MLDGDWPQRKKGAMNVLSEAREKGVIKTHGTSCHTLDALKTAARTPWVQVDLARINPAGVAMDADPKTVISVLRQMKAAGKGVMGMKIFGAGKLRDKTDECLQFALALDCVDCFTIGSESRAEVAVARAEERYLPYYRKGYCELFGALVTRDSDSFQAAAKDFMEAIANWPKKLVPRPPAGLPALVSLARLEQGRSADSYPDTL